MIHKPLSPDPVRPNQFVLEIVIPLPCSSGLVRHILLFIFWKKKKLISFIAPSTNATPAFSTLSFQLTLFLFLCLQCNTNKF